ncbi:Adhesion G Protein-Coupled Receptor F5 [Manis pentadactyla]|nr:Adhesion G Protein-Coupled Receptor F5 [Manis pentadactyla]
MVYVRIRKTDEIYNSCITVEDGDYDMAFHPDNSSDGKSKYVTLQPVHINSDFHYQLSSTDNRIFDVIISGLFLVPFRLLFRITRLHLVPKTFQENKMFIVTMASSCKKYNSLDLGHDLQGPAVDNRDGPARMGRVLALFSEDHSFMGLENVGLENQKSLSKLKGKQIDDEEV